MRNVSFTDFGEDVCRNRHKEHAVQHLWDSFAQKTKARHTPFNYNTPVMTDVNPINLNTPS